MYLCSQIQLNFINISQILIQDLMCVSCSVVKLCSLLHKIETKTSNLYKKKKCVWSPSRYYIGLAKKFVWVFL